MTTTHRRCADPRGGELPAGLHDPTGLERLQTTTHRPASRARVHGGRTSSTCIRSPVCSQRQAAIDDLVLEPRRSAVRTARVRRAAPLEDQRIDDPGGFAGHIRRPRRIGKIADRQIDLAAYFQIGEKQRTHASRAEVAADLAAARQWIRPRNARSSICMISPSMPVISPALVTRRLPSGKRCNARSGERPMRSDCGCSPPSSRCRPYQPFARAA